MLNLLTLKFQFAFPKTATDPRFVRTPLGCGAAFYHAASLVRLSPGVPRSTLHARAAHGDAVTVASGLFCSIAFCLIRAVGQTFTDVKKAGTSKYLAHGHVYLRGVQVLRCTINQCD